MKKFALLCVVLLVVGFTGTAFAARAPKAPKVPKVLVCHNGGVYNGDVTVGTSYDVDAWGPGSFIISISENAVPAHLNNHGDCLAATPTEGSAGVVTEVSTAAVLEGEEVVDIVVTGSEMQTACECLLPE